MQGRPRTGAAGCRLRHPISARSALFANLDSRRTGICGCDQLDLPCSGGVTPQRSCSSDFRRCDPTELRLLWLESEGPLQSRGYCMILFPVRATNRAILPVLCRDPGSGTSSKIRGAAATTLTMDQPDRTVLRLAHRAANSARRPPIHKALETAITDYIAIRNADPKQIA